MNRNTTTHTVTTTTVTRYVDDMKNDSHDNPPEQQTARRVLRIDAVGMRIAQRRILHDRREQFAELGRWYDTDNECWCKERPA